MIAQRTQSRNSHEWYNRPMDYVPRRTLDLAVHRAGRAALRDRLHALRALAGIRGLRYFDDAGRPRLIDMTLVPWVLTSAQLWHFHHVIQLLAGALARLPALRDRIPAIREILPVDPAREAWLRISARPHAKPLAVIGRLDSTASYDHAGWRAAYRMLEPNTVGVGGLHYAPTACRISLDLVGDLLARALPGRAITATPDPRALLLEELRAVARRLGRPLRGVALIENTEDMTGTDEFSELAAWLTAHEVRAIVADPRQLTLRRGHIYHGRMEIDLLYRDSELAELVEMERGSRRLTALREAVRQGRLISGLMWEYDQKSAWEVFTDARFAKLFSLEQQRFFRQHVLWTRLVRHARTTDPRGRAIDLAAYVRTHQRQLVLKPNNLFGGEGVVLGRLASRAHWERTLARALSGREPYVVQALAHVPTETSPMLEDERVIQATRHVVSGFFFNSTSIGLVGRFSGAPVVNVSRGGGLIPALWVHGT